MFVHVNEMQAFRGNFIRLSVQDVFFLFQLAQVRDCTE